MADWKFYFLLVEDKPASIFLDLNLRSSAPLASHPMFGRVRLRVRQPDENGFPSKVEFQVLRNVEDALTPRIAAECGAMYVGRLTSDGCQEFYFYATDEPAFIAAASAATNDHPLYAFDVSAQPDPEWKIYVEFLYPSPDELQIMLNRGLLRELARRGDALEEPRQVDHFAIFADASGCDAFVKYATANGFTISNGYPLRDDDKVMVEFSRVDKPSEMDGVVLSLHPVLQEHGGEYDGWGCTVVSASFLGRRRAGPPVWLEVKLASAWQALKMLVAWS